MKTRVARGSGLPARWLIVRAVGAAALVALGALGGCATSPDSRAGPPADFEASFWPPLPSEPRIQFLRSFRLSSDVEQERSAIDKIVFGDDVKPIPIAKPYGVAMWKGRLYVCDITNPNVVILDLEARQTRLMLTRGVEPMAQPTDIAIADDGMKYVIDRRIGRIFVFSADDRHIATFGEPGLIPTGVAVHGDEIFVPDFQTQTVLVLDRFRGTQRRAIGSPGGGEGQFVRPLGVDVDDDGAVSVGDAIRGRVQRFDARGNLVLSVGEIGDGAGSFVRPKHVVVDHDGILYVVDAAFQNVQMFNDDGDVLMFFGGPGAFAGAMSLPAGIAVSDDGLHLFDDMVHPAFDATRLVIVTNQFGPNKVSVYALGRLREGYTVEDLMPITDEVPPELMPSPPPDETDG
jgi:sugar lactone lactonase YvrE